MTDNKEIFNLLNLELEKEESQGDKVYRNPTKKAKKVQGLTGIYEIQEKEKQRSFGLIFKPFLEMKLSQRSYVVKRKKSSLPNENMAKKSLPQGNHTMEKSPSSDISMAKKSQLLGKVTSEKSSPSNISMAKRSQLFDKVTSEKSPLSI
ncbi:6049_t:CDS:2 [Acaulospora colombiana]|uniref:6049_t:CDS:1 n=1 Tax=Acaulospora colombiana TaxID=27376 RepID=A0ACA9KRW7_9GLOM|nr:6049_t:CDS:2 [Acaulospora colombiana]